MRQRSGPVEVIVTIAADGDEEDSGSDETPKARISHLATGTIVERTAVDLTAKTCERTQTGKTIDFWCDDSAGVAVGDRVKVIQDDDGEFSLFWAEC